MNNMKIGGINGVSYNQSLQMAGNEPKLLNQEMPADSFEGTKEVKNTDKIGFLRLVFNRLTKEQIKRVNETGELPKGAKFIEDGYGNPHITWNKFNVTRGTRTLPAGYELKRNILGFTRVVRKDTEGLLIKD